MADSLSPPPKGPILLLTGAPGWLADVFLSKLPQTPLSGRVRVRCLLQNTLTPERELAWRFRHPGVAEVVKGDLRDPATLQAACAGLEGGLVLHSAAIMHPRRVEDWYLVNRDGTVNLARAAKAAGATRFAYVSTNAAQGAAYSPKQVLTEDMPAHPLSHYGKSKREGEKGLLDLHEPGRFEAVIGRPCMFYGPPVPARHIAIFKRLLAGRLPLVGGGNYARSVSYVDDVSAGLSLCLTHPKAAGEIFNLCDATTWTSLKIYEAMAQALGVKPRFIPLPGCAATVANFIDHTLCACGYYSMPFHLLGEANWNVGASCRKAVELLGFQPTGNVFAGYRQAVQWCRAQKLL